MAYAGINPNSNTENRVTQTFNGDGTTVAFTLTNFAGSVDNIDCAVGGVYQTPSVDFTLNNLVVTFISGAPPAGTANVVFNYGVALPQGYANIPNGTLLGAQLNPNDGANLRIAIGLQNATGGDTTGSYRMQVGTTAQRPATPVTGDFRTNTTTNSVERYDGANWVSMGGGATGGGADAAFIENDTVISANYTIGQGAMVSGVTVTIASPGVFNLANHGFVVGHQVRLTTTGALPTGLDSISMYYVIAAGLGTNTFQLSSTYNGTAIITTGTQSGVHSVGKLKNANSAGTVTILDGVTVGIPTGSSWSME